MDFHFLLRIQEHLCRSALFRLNIFFFPSATRTVLHCMSFLIGSMHQATEIALTLSYCVEGDPPMLRLKHGRHHFQLGRPLLAAKLDAPRSSLKKSSAFLANLPSRPNHNRP